MLFNVILVILGNVWEISNNIFFGATMEIKKKRRKRRISRKLELRIKIVSFIIICFAGLGIGIWYFTSNTV